MSNPTNIDDIFIRINELVGRVSAKAAELAEAPKLLERMNDELKEIGSLAARGRAMCSSLEDGLSQIAKELKDFDSQVEDAAIALHTVNQILKAELISEAVEKIGGKESEVVHDLAERLLEFKDTVY